MNQHPAKLKTRAQGLFALSFVAAMAIAVSSTSSLQAQETEADDDMDFESEDSWALFGAYDTQIGDQWGGVLILEKFVVGGSVGGFFTNQVVDDATDQINSSILSRYGDIGSFESDAYSFTVYGAYRFDMFYVGAGYTGIEVSSITGSLEANGVRADVSGSGSMNSADGFVGFSNFDDSGIYYDIRFGYRQPLSNELNGKVRASDGQDSQTTSFNFSDAESLLEGVFGTVSLGWRF